MKPSVCSPPLLPALPARSDDLSSPAYFSDFHTESCLCPEDLPTDFPSTAPPNTLSSPVSLCPDTEVPCQVSGMVHPAYLYPVSERADRKECSSATENGSHSALVCCGTPLNPSIPYLHLTFLLSLRPGNGRPCRLSPSSQLRWLHMVFRNTQTISQI